MRLEDPPLDLPPAPRILIVRVSAIGDVICALPVASALKRRFPDAHITWLVETTSADLLQHHPHVDRVCVLPRRGIRRAWKLPWTVPSAVLDILRRLRRCREGGRFDLVLDLQGNTKSGIFTGLSRGRIRVGHDGRFRKEWSNALFTNVRVHPVPESEPTLHRVERDLGMLRAVGIPARFEPVPLALPDAVRSRARDFVAGLPGSGPVVVLHPGTSAFGAFKRWDPTRYAELGDRLSRERDARIVISWGPDEEDLARSVSGRMSAGATLFPPPEGLLFLAAVFAEVDLVIGADSGPMHLAALMDTPTLTLFGPKDPAIFQPMGDRARAVWMNVECSPCQLRVCDHVTCMRSMRVEDVARPALAILERPREEPGAPPRKGEKPRPRA